METHGFMRYQCESCEKEWNMWLEKGLEDMKDDARTGKHKPVPFIIKCPHCGGLARDISGVVPITGYRPLLEHMNRFENKSDCDRGIPVFYREN